MKVPNNWLRSLAIGLSFPSMILTTGYISAKLVEYNIIEKKMAVILFIGLTSSFLFLLVLYGIKKKD
jgi:hypothetical protein